MKLFDQRFALWYSDGERCVKTCDAYWENPLRLHRRLEDSELWSPTSAVRQSQRLFIDCDVFEDVVGGLCTFEVRQKLFMLIDATPNFDWLLATRRPENIRRRWPQTQLNRYLGGPGPGLLGSYRPNVWLLTSVEDQETADARIPELLKSRDLTPVLGLNCEPLLGPVNLTDIPAPRDLQKSPNGGLCFNALQSDDARYYEPPGYLDWVIAGGEIGLGARPMHPDWARSLRDQCAVAGVPFFYTQNGEWVANGDAHARAEKGIAKGESERVVNLAGGHGFHGISPLVMKRVGKVAAGRQLDGQTHDGFPQPVSRLTP